MLTVAVADRRAPGERRGCRSRGRPPPTRHRRQQSEPGDRGAGAYHIWPNGPTPTSCENFGPSCAFGGRRRSDRIKNFPRAQPSLARQILGPDRPGDPPRNSPMRPLAGGDSDHEFPPAIVARSRRLGSTFLDRNRGGRRHRGDRRSGRVGRGRAGIARSGRIAAANHRGRQEQRDRRSDPESDGTPHRFDPPFPGKTPVVADDRRLNLTCTRA